MSALAYVSPVVCADVRTTPNIGGWCAHSSTSTSNVHQVTAKLTLKILRYGSARRLLSLGTTFLLARVGWLAGYLGSERGNTTIPRQRVRMRMARDAMMLWPAAYTTQGAIANLLAGRHWITLTNRVAVFMFGQ